jgi:electron transfer flavoprotein beta subunit
MKAVVDPQSRIEVDAAGELQRQHLSYEINEYDLYAVEEALRLADATDGQVTLITLGNDGAVAGLRKGLAMGGTDAIHVDTDPLVLDPAATALLLADALRDREFDLVLAGVESDDLAGSQVGVLLAENLAMPSATLVIETSVPVDGRMQIRRELEGGAFARMEIDVPAVLTIQSGLNEPRYPSLKGIMAAKRKELTTVTPGDLGHAELPALRVESLGLSTPPARERARMLEGGAEAAVAELVRILRQEEKVL